MSSVRPEIEDCGQDGVCKLAPGCNRHWEERNRELVRALVEAVTERDRLRKIFDDAGQGEHNVLALIDYYQRNSNDAEERLRAVRLLLVEYGCDCLCDHRPDERSPDCEVCLACRLREAVGQ